VGVLLFCLVFFPAWSFWKESPPEPRSPSFSPDNQHLVLSIVYKGQSHIYRIKKDGTDLTQMTHLPGNVSDPVYSPDGRQIVFSHGSKSFRDPLHLYIMNADGSGVTQITFGDYADANAVFSPDGQYIYFIRSRKFGRSSPLVPESWRGMDIYSVKPDGTNLKAVTNENFYKISAPSFSPNGKEFLTQITNPSEKDYLWEVPLDNPKARKPFKPDLEEYLKKKQKSHFNEKNMYQYLYEPCFSYAGRFALFVWAEDKRKKGGYYEYDLYRVDMRNSLVSRLTHFDQMVISPQISFDDQEIVFMLDPTWPRGKAPFEIWLVNSDGTNPHRIDVDLKNCLNCASTPASF
jgi:Tol biopolymer transport system component